MLKDYTRPDMLIRLHNETSDVMTASQQVGVEWNNAWGEAWDPYNA